MTKDDMEEELAKYVLELAEACGKTKRAEDRPIYEDLLADAAILLALLITKADREHINRVVAAHERLWGQTWLQDEVYRKPAEAFERFKALLK